LSVSENSGPNGKYIVSIIDDWNRGLKYKTDRREVLYAYEVSTSTHW
jgi:hypothetical protein